MKRVDFLDLVCAELAQMGVEDAEVKIQRANIENYLAGMGVGEESPMLDRENPASFAKLIFGNVAKRKNEPKEELTQTAYPSGNEFSEELPDIDCIEYDGENDASYCVGEADLNTGDTDQSDSYDGEFYDGDGSNAEDYAPEDDSDYYGDGPQYLSEPDPSEDGDMRILSEGGETEPYCGEEWHDGQAYSDYDPLTAPVTDYIEPDPAEKQYTDGEPFCGGQGEEAYDPESCDPLDAPEQDVTGGTIEFAAQPQKKTNAEVPGGKVEAGEDYFEKNKYDDYVPTGNPVLFWVLVGLTAIFWIPILAVAVIGVGLAFVFMVLFEALYIPGIIAVIIGGAGVTFAELVYSIIKFAGKNPAVGIFELGLGLIVAALTLSLPTAMYFIGVSVFPKCIKNYRRNVKELYIRLRRAFRRLKGACSI